MKKLILFSDYLNGKSRNLGIYQNATFYNDVKVAWFSSYFSF